MKFGAVAECVNDRIDDPAKAGVDRYVGLEHLDPETLTIRRWGAPEEVESTKLRFKPGDIIFGKRRAYQRKLAVADFDGICSAHAMVLRAKPGAMLPEFLPFFMHSDLFMERAIAISVGSLSPTINWKTLAAEEFAVPPLKEQRRLAAILLATARCADSAAELAVETLRVSLAHLEHRFAIARRVSRLVPIDEISEFVTKGESPRWQGFEYQSSGVRFITSENVLDGALSLAPEKFVPREFGTKLRRSSLVADDVLINIVGGSIGRMCSVPAGIGSANVNQAVAVVRVERSRILPEYLLAYLRSPRARHELVTRSVDDYKPNLSLTSIRQFRVPLFGLEEQRVLLGEHSALEAARVAAHGRASAARALTRQILTAEAQRSA